MPFKAVLLLLAAACVWRVDICACFPNGSVEFSCGTMMPGHPPYTASTSSSPFTVSASSATYSPGGVVTVTVETVSNSSANFRGFLLQARSTQQQAALWPVGKFANLDAAQFKALDCNNIMSSAVSQASGSQKSKVQLTWNAPSDNSSGDVYFSASVVQSYTTFWVQLNSSTVRVSSSSSGGGGGVGATVVFSSFALLVSLLMTH